MAFLLCVGLSDYGGLRRLLYCVAHPLTGRYKHWHSSKNSNVHSLIKLLIGIYAQ
ncbi:TPA: hypothetical protein P0E34_005110 [Vibrio campbellii]|nr:hypothetical protein [Vibrio campbellii]